jgi:hypothetical protein
MPLQVGLTEIFARLLSFIRCSWAIGRRDSSQDEIENWDLCDTDTLNLEASAVGKSIKVKLSLVTHMKACVRMEM